MTSQPAPSAWRSHGFAVGTLIVVMVLMGAVLPPISDDTRADLVELPDVGDAAAATSTTDATDEQPLVESHAPSPPSSVTVEAEQPTTTTVPATTEPVATTEPTPTTEPARTTVPPTTETVPASSAPKTTTPPRSDPTTVPAAGDGPLVTSIQTVPEVRNLIMLVDGEPRATDTNGAVQLAPDEFAATIEIVGLAAEPSIERVALLQWSDGSRELERSLGGVSGPVIELGLEVRNRVFVELAPSAPELTSVGFIASSGEELVLTIDEPAWVTRARAVLVDGRLVADELEYELDVDGLGLRPETYRARPEASWVIEGR